MFGLQIQELSVALPEQYGELFKKGPMHTSVLTQFNPELLIDVFSPQS